MPKRIQTGHDVEVWAADIVAAKGTKFTSLSKGELLVIAEYVMSIRIAEAAIARHEGGGASETENDGGSGDPHGEEAASEPVLNPPVLNPPVPPPAEPVAADADTTPAAEDGRIPAVASGQSVRTAMTRAETLRAEGKDAQGAFDEFLGWCASHPKEREVMDFATGSRSSAAAFAYWLSTHE